MLNLFIYDIKVVKLTFIIHVFLIRVNSLLKRDTFKRTEKHLRKSQKAPTWFFTSVKK